MSRATAITIGNFDGVHRGHQQLLRTARGRVGREGRVVALVFEAHPLSILRPDRAPTPLTTITQRERWLFECGVDEVVRLKPTLDLLSRSPEEFIDEVVGGYQPSFIIEGSDFRFGKGRSGSMETLRRIGRRLGFEAVEVDSVEVVLSAHARIRVSSTMARWLVRRGRVRDVQVLLGRPLEIESPVVEGARRGRAIGFPTANLAPNGCLLPRDGVYAGLATMPEGTEHVAAISIGSNPTFPEGRHTCEAYLLDYKGSVDEYGWTIRLSFHAWIRDQVQFHSVEGLLQQMNRDVDRIRQLIYSTFATA